MQYWDSKVLGVGWFVLNKYVSTRCCGYLVILQLISEVNTELTGQVLVVGRNF